MTNSIIQHNNTQESDWVINLYELCETYTDFVLQDLIVHKGDYATKAYGQRK